MREAQRGFSMIELLVVLLILSLIMGAVFEQVALVQQRSSAEQVKLDMFQEGREFMDQLTRDLHQAGYPSPVNFDNNQIGGPSSPPENDPKAAVGLVKADIAELIFEGDVDGTGNVASVQYRLQTTGANCPCLRRSQIYKEAGPPYPPQGSAVFQTEVQDVLNGVSETDPIFEAFTTNGVQVSLPVDFANDADTIADINTIRVILKLRSKFPDPKTGQRPVSTMISTIKLNNCSQAAQGRTMSCW